MRPINLIPPEERRSHGASSRTGPLAYIVVGALALLLLGVVMLVLTSNQISDREGEVASLETQKAAAVARAERLAPYASFQQVSEQRTQTVASLADSRFDWPRVIRELSLILPPKVYLTSLTGSAGGGGEGASSEIAGPSLTMLGCTAGQDTVAAFVASLKQIDGVTRVGLKNSTLSESSGTVATGVPFCSRGSKAQFEIIVAFDLAPPSPDGAEALSAEAPAESSESEGSEAESSESSSSSESESSSSAEPAATSSTSSESAG